MSIDWSRFASLIDLHQRFVVTTHVRPDGDALGSEVGMVGLLRQKGKDVRVVNASRTPPRYDYLDPDETLFRHYGSQIHDADLTDREALVILDLSSWSQLGDFANWVRTFPGLRIVVDHHVSQDDLGATYFKDTTAEATGTLVFQAARALGVPITPEMANGLFTAIAMDTGWFRHPNTKPSTLVTIGELVAAGAKIDEIYRLIFERNTLARLKLMGETLSSLKTDLNGRIAYAAVSREDFERTGAIPADTEDLVDYTVSLAGVDVGILFIEQQRGGIKASLRSRNGMDCAKVAAVFGGGGHKAAAGAGMSDPLDEAVAKMLAAVRAELATP